MKKKALALAVAGALVSPAAFAAQDTSGMQYTSAAEGFYASIRARYNSNDGTTGSDASIGNSTSRIGVRGTNDLGGGLSGFYQLEWSSAIDNGNGTPFGLRHGHVGLRGAFGEIRLGSGWNHIYNNVTSATDIAAVGSGNLYGKIKLNARDANTIQYDSPDLNGFKVGVDAQLNDDGNGDDVDRWGVSGHYSVAGFSVGAAYNVDVNGIATVPAWADSDPAAGVQSASAIAGEVAQQDATAYALKAGYAQDNWYVNTWYGVDNNSDKNRPGEDDNTIFSIAGGVTVDKIDVYFLHENWERSTTDYTGTGAFTADNIMAGDDAYSTFGVQYKMGANTRVWIEYAARDLDSETDEDDTVTMGLRHDF